MAEPVRSHDPLQNYPTTDEPLNTADFARRPGAYAIDSNLPEEALNDDPPRPLLIQNDAQSLPGQATGKTPEIRRNWETGATPALDARPNPSEMDGPLFNEAEINDYRSRWSNVQTGFVDEPRRSVEEADHLVASVMQRLAEGFANERAGLEKQWDHGENVSTEDLRIALQRYRAFFGRLLNVA